MRISLLLFLSLFLLAACSSTPDCSEFDTSYATYSYNEETKECVISEQIQKDVCGNGIAEEGESFCDCPEDVSKNHPELGCSGTLGEYLEKSCNNQKLCVLTQNEKVVPQTKKVDFKNSDLTLQGEITIQTPFILNSDDNNRVLLDLTLFKTSSSSNIKNIIVKEVSLENSKAIVLASSDIDEAAGAVGYEFKRVNLFLADTTEYESKENLKAKLVVQYTKEFLNSQDEVTRTEEKIETFTVSIGSWVIINPNFEK